MRAGFLFASSGKGSLLDLTAALFCSWVSAALLPTAFAPQHSPGAALGPCGPSFGQDAIRARFYSKAYMKTLTLKGFAFLHGVFDDSIITLCRQNEMQEQKRFATKSDNIACLGSFCTNSFYDRFCDHGRL